MTTGRINQVTIEPSGRGGGVRGIPIRPPQGDRRHFSNKRDCGTVEGQRHFPRLVDSFLYPVLASSEHSLSFSYRISKRPSMETVLTGRTDCKSPIPRRIPELLITSHRSDPLAIHPQTLILTTPKADTTALRETRHIRQRSVTDRGPNPLPS